MRCLELKINDNSFKCQMRSGFMMVLYGMFNKIVLLPTDCEVKTWTGMVAPSSPLWHICHGQTCFYDGNLHCQSTAKLGSNSF